MINFLKPNWSSPLNIFPGWGKPVVPCWSASWPQLEKATLTVVAYSSLLLEPHTCIEYKYYEGKHLYSLETGDQGLPGVYLWMCLILLCVYWGKDRCCSDSVKVSCHMSKTVVIHVQCNILKDHYFVAWNLQFWTWHRRSAC